jgi:hypothetical protein
VKRSLVLTPAVGTLVAAIAIGLCGCATGTSAVAASTHGKASVYRSATAYVELAPDKAFNPAVKMLLERGDIEITDLKEANNRCKAVAGDRTLTFRVIESGTGRSRLSVLVGGGDNPDANQELADRLMQQICGRLEVACESGTGAP